MSEIEFYIMQFSPDIQRRLLDIRSIAVEAFCNAEEKIYHNVPTFMINGKDIMCYGAYKDHITLYLGYDVTDFLKSIYPQYHYTKAAMHIYHKDSFPYELVKDICGLLKQNYAV